MDGVQGYLRSIFFIVACLISVSGKAADTSGSIGQVLETYRDKVEFRLIPYFQYAGVNWPPEEMQLLAVKDTRRMELWARSGNGWRHVRDYKIKGMSGALGPKLKEGDLQVPEGIYRISRLNPNSSFHLSLKVDYPNAYDREMAQRDGRRQLGGDIFIHGSRVSRGCLAMGDNAIEELFVLAALLGKDQVGLLIAPVDFRIYSAEQRWPGSPDWSNDLYRNIAAEMRRFEHRKE